MAKSSAGKPASPTVDSTATVVAVYIALITLTLAVFWPVHSFEFVAFDDVDYIVENAQVQAGLTGTGIRWAFTAFHSSNYHPLTWLAHMVDCALFGLNAGGHHLSNLLMHILASCLLLRVLHLATRQLWPSLLVATLFAIHPLHVESVAWVSERKDTLSTVLWMLTLWLYVRYARKPGTLRYLAVAGCLLLGLLAKQMLVTVPCVLLLMDIWPLKRVSLSQGRSALPEFRRLAIEKLPLLGLAIVFCALVVIAQGEAVASTDVIPLSHRFTNAIVAYVGYLWHTIAPIGLIYYYPHPLASLSMLKIIGAAGLLIAVSYGAVRCGVRKPYLVVGWLWYVGTLVPVIGIVQVGAQAMADRYTYVPLIGVFIALAWGLRDCVESRPKLRGAVGAISAVAVAVLALLAHRQVGTWRNTNTLAAHALQYSPTNHMVHEMLGRHLFLRGEGEKAIGHLVESIKHAPDWAKSRAALGAAYLKDNRLEEALPHLERAVALNQNLPEAQYNLGLALKRSGRLEAAESALARAVELEPAHAEATLELAGLTAASGNQAEASRLYDRALALKPGWVNVYVNQGQAFAKAGKLSEAMPLFAKALELQPDLIPARQNLARALRESGKLERALNEYRIILKQAPDHAVALRGIASCLTDLGRPDEALDHLAQAEISIAVPIYRAIVAESLQAKAYAAALPALRQLTVADSANPRVHREYAFCLTQMGDLPGASEAFRAALALAPDANTYTNLGNIWARQKEWAKAVDCFERALKIDPSHQAAAGSLKRVQEIEGAHR